MIHVLIGSYTHRAKTGIYQGILDEKTGEFQLVKAYEGIENPSYLLADGDQDHVYAVSETQGGFGGAVVGYKIEREHSFSLCLEAQQLSHGDDPCHLAKFGGNLIVSNYTSGNFSSYPIDGKGRQQEVAQSIQHKGKGPHESRQEGAHVHFSALTPDRTLLAVVDLGLDQVCFYSMQQEGFSLFSTLQCTPGAGPRHLAFHPRLPLIYIVNELNSTAAVYRHDETYTAFECLQTISTIPEDFSENNQCAAIVMSRDAKYIYISNRGHDSIAVFAIDGSSGQLSLIELTGAGGRWPRDCALTPDGRYLFVANEWSDDLALFERSASDGTLKEVSSYKVSEPTCVIFVP